MYWIPTVVLLTHIAEEYWRFPEWASRHFGATSRAWYVYSHIFLVMLAVVITARAQTAPETIWLMLATGLQWVLATNAIFHIVATAFFREYSPGLFTGTFVGLPATAYLFNGVLSQGHLTLPQVALAVGFGTVVSGIGVASLWLHMDLDWRLRRPEAS